MLITLLMEYLLHCVSNFAPDGKLVYIDVTSQLLSNEMQCKTTDSLQHGKAHYVQKDGKQRKGHL